MKSNSMNYTYLINEFIKKDKNRNSLAIRRSYKPLDSTSSVGMKVQNEI